MKLWIPNLFIFSFILFLIVAMRTEIFNKWVGYSLFVVSVFALVIISTIAVFVWFKNIGDMTATSNEPKIGLASHLLYLNKLLEDMPNGDTIEWKGGENIRVARKSFIDIDNKVKSYLGIIGRQTHKRKLVSIIYCIEDKDIVEFIGDPSPNRLKNPLYKFSPYHQQFNMRQYDRFDRLDRFDNDYRRDYRGVNVNIGSGQNEDYARPSRDIIDKARDAVNDNSEEVSKKKRKW